MPHSPTNSRHSPTSSRSSTRSVSPLPENINRWLASFTDLELDPHGPVPESEMLNRRNSIPGGSRIQLLRLPVELPINNQHNILARTSVIVMKVIDPNSPFPYKLQIPKKWWTIDPKLGLRSDNIRAALRDQVVARFHSRMADEPFLDQYIKELRQDVENAIQKLPATMFDFRSVQDAVSPQLPGPAESESWHVSYEALPEIGSLKMLLLRGGDDGIEVEVDIILPPAVLVQSQSAVSDWLLMQICI